MLRPGLMGATQGCRKVPRGSATEPRSSEPEAPSTTIAQVSVSPAITQAGQISDRAYNIDVELPRRVAHCTHGNATWLTVPAGPLAVNSNVLLCGAIEVGNPLRAPFASTLSAPTGVLALKRPS